jgi:hypothetical protein
MAQPIVGIGASFQFANTFSSPFVFTILNGVDSIAFSGDKVATEKTTTMATVNGVETYIGSVQEPGSVDVKAFWLPGDATQNALEVIRAAAQAVEFRANYGSSNSRSFDGIVESMTVSHPLDKPARLDIKIKLTGPWTIL